MLGSQPQRIKLDKMIKVRKVEVAVIIVKLIVIDCNENDKNKKREEGREGGREGGGGAVKQNRRF